MKIKVKEYCGYQCSFDMHIIDFFRADGTTYAVVVVEGGLIETYDIKNLTIDYDKFMI